MTKPQDADQEQTAPASPYVRLPVPVVAAALALFLVILLGAGLYANANLRPQGIVVPTPVAAAALPTQTLPPPTAAPLVQPTATTAAATPTVKPTQVAQIRETATSEATPVPTVTARPTVSPELQTEVGDAYQTYWQVRAEALYELDTEHLDEVMAGDHLSAIQDRIAELRTEGRAIETEVDHDYAVVEATSDSARVADSYVDRSIYVDAKTHAELSTPTGQRVSELYVMTKSDETWRVTDLERSP